MIKDHESNIRKRSTHPIVVHSNGFRGGVFELCVWQQGSDRPLTNAAVVKLVKAGFKEKTIIAIIRQQAQQI